MDNGISRSECAAANKAPHPIIDVPADSVPRVPTGIPPVVEPTVSGHLVKAKKKTGPKPIATQYRMEMINKFITGDFEGGEINRLKFLRVTQFTPQEKSYLLKHVCFQELYDARIFDMFLDPTQMPTKEELKLVEIIGRRLGLNKAPASQVNVQVNNNNTRSKDEDKPDNSPIQIKVQR